MTALISRPQREELLIGATRNRKGMIIRLDGELQSAFFLEYLAPGKGRAYVRTKLRDRKTGRTAGNRQGKYLEGVK